MSWHPGMEFNYADTNFSYNSAGSFLEGLAHEHANFIFSDALNSQSMYPVMQTNSYRVDLPGPDGVSYYDHCYVPVLNHHLPNITECDGHLGNPTTVTNEQTAEPYSPQWEDNSTIATNSYHVQCPRPQDHQSVHDQHIFWQDDVDPDNMTYEVYGGSNAMSFDEQELLELGEAVGTQSRGLSQDIISTLPVRKFKCGFFTRKKTKNERCVICQMEYKRGEKQIILPCKHAYHTGCGTKWLSINKACPICYTEVFGDGSKQ